MSKLEAANMAFIMQKIERRRKVEREVRSLWVDYRSKKKTKKSQTTEELIAESEVVSDVNDKVSKLWAEYGETNRKEYARIMSLASEKEPTP